MWKNPDEERPEDRQLCACQMFDGSIQIGRWNSEEVEWEMSDGSGKWGHARAWAPLDEPPLEWKS